MSRRNAARRAGREAGAAADATPFRHRNLPLLLLQARESVISSPSLAGVLARMDELGLVRRERMAEDQRRVKVSLTPRSRALAAAMAPKIEAVYEALEAHVGRDFIDRFYATLAELIGLLGELPPVDEG